MAIGKVITGINHSLFDEFYELFHSHLKKYDDWDFELFLQIPNLRKVDILEYFENVFLDTILWDMCEFGDVVFPLFFTKNESVINSITPSYNSEYINIIGQLFLAGYIDFCSYYDEVEHLANLSSYKEDKYQAWTYFRDNFFYANAFCKTDEDDILIYKDKEYTEKTLPKRKKGEIFYSTMYSGASWDEPKYWSQYNILVARTEKGTKYFNEILAPKFYEKYKDLEVEIDDKGNIIRWIGEINRTP